MPSFELEKKYPGIVVGIDEVGCGPWAGPVVAASFYFKNYIIAADILNSINDSKQLSVKKRKLIYDVLINNNDQWGYAIGCASVNEIDQLNIRQAALLAMQRSYKALDVKACIALIDGTGSPTLGIPLQLVTRGDSLSYTIAAASIIAKEYRDQLMQKLARDHPHYSWERNAGYGTQLHQDGLESYGITPHHRKSFKPIQRYI